MHKDTLLKVALKGFKLLTSSFLVVMIFRSHLGYVQYDLQIINTEGKSTMVICTHIVFYASASTKLFLLSWEPGTNQPSDN